MNFLDYMDSDYEGAGYVFITPNNKILMLQKTNKKWSFPGGHREPGEIPIKTAMRETQEEIGFMPKGETVNFTKYIKKETNGNCYSFIMKVKEPFGVSLSNEHINFKWVAFKDIDSLKLSKAVLDLWPNLKQIISAEIQS
jgi:8-oxo-dGTP pyrophosphatase MutT (NUDIX family)